MFNSLLGVDTGGNIGLTFGTGFDAVKLAPNGTTSWHQRNPSACGDALGQAVVVDSGGNIYVAGSYPYFCNDGLVNSEYFVIKYDANGTQLWTTSYQDGGKQWQTDGLVVDTANNLYVAGNFIGGSGSKYVGFAYDANGNFLWSAFPMIYLTSWDTAAGVNTKRCMIMTGKIPTAFLPDNTPLFSYGTMQLSTNGSTLWTSFYPPTATATSVANAIAVDQANNAYVTGYSPGTNGTNNIVTIKYDPNGNQLWLQSYNGLNAGNDAGNAIAVDKNGNVYVTGYETLPSGGTSIVTIKYIPISIQRQTNGTVSIETQGSPGESFDIQASSDLLNWLDLGSVLADTNGLMQFDDTNAPNFPARFYYTNPQ